METRSATQRRVGFSILGVLAQAVAAVVLSALPIGLVHAQQGPLLYVPNGVGDSVSVFRLDATGSLTAVTTLAAFGNSPEQAVVRGDQAFAYVTLNLDNQVKVIDTKTNTAVQTVSGLTGPRGIAVSPDGTRVAVANNTGGINSVSVFTANPVTGQLSALTTINTGANTQPRRVVFSPDGSRLFIANQGNLGTNGSVAVVDTATNAIIATVLTGGQLTDIAINPAGSRVYTVSTTNQVFVIDTATSSVVATPATGGDARGVVVSPDGTRFYVANQNANTINQFDATTNTSLGTVAGTGVTPFGIVTSPDGGFAYVVNNTSNNVSIFSITSGTGPLVGAGTVATGSAPTYGGICRNGNAMLGTGATFVASSAAAFGCFGTSTPTFTGGTLLINDANLSLASALSLGTGGGAIDTNGNNATLSGAITGAGGLTKAGAGVLTLSGSSTYSGSTLVNAGTLRAGAANAFSSASAFTVATGATLDLNSLAQTIGSLAGAGNVMLGTATLTVGGNGSSTTFSGAISGGGGLTKAGVGMLALTGASTYAGMTSVSAGTLSVNGSLASPVTVNSGGALAGTGTIGGANIMSGGIFAPGNSIGTMTVSGNVAFAAGSIYRVEADAAGNADRINATGIATLSGGTVDVQASAGTYQRNTIYTILNASGGVTGTFASVTSNLAFLTPSLAYNPNNVLLALTRNDTPFTAVAATPNQTAVASYLDMVTSDPALGGLVAQLDGLSATQAQAAFASIGGDSLSAFSRVAMAETGRFLRLLTGRTTTAGAGTGLRLAAGNVFANDLPAGYAPAGGPAAAAARPGTGRGVWIQGDGSRGNVDGNGNAIGFDWRSYGLAGGVDTEVSRGTVLGAALSYGHANVSLDRSGSGEVTSPRLALYGSSASGGWELRGAAGYAREDFDTRRVVAIGPNAGVAAGSHRGDEWAFSAEAEYSVPLGGNQLKPLFGLRYINLREDAYTEAGSAAPLTVAGRTTESVVSLLGLRYVVPINAGAGSMEARAIWSHEFGDANPAVTGRLASASAGATFTVAGVPIKRDALTLGAGFSNQATRNLSLYADFNAEVRGSGQSLYALLGGLRYAW